VLSSALALTAEPTGRAQPTTPFYDQLEVKSCTNWENSDAPGMNTFITYVVFLISFSTVLGWKLTIFMMMLYSGKKNGWYIEGLSTDPFDSSPFAHNTGVTLLASMNCLTG
jgi:hypothetical protein